MACDRVMYSPAVYNRLSVMAIRDFNYRLLIDDLPSATVIRRDPSTTNADVMKLDEIFYDHGIPVAEFDGHYKKLSVYNHLIFTVETHKVKEDVRIVGFEVEAKSIEWGDEPCSFVPSQSPESISGAALYKNDTRVSYTYEFKIKPSDTVWAHRFDHYVKTGKDYVHHLQFLLSCLIAFISSAALYAILKRALSSDYDKSERNTRKLRDMKNKRRSALYQ